MENLSPSIQDYLKHIFALTEDHDLATTNALAERLKIAPASVTSMLQKLAVMDPPLVVYHKHQGAALTPQGQQAALSVIRRHRLLETWLTNSLGYTWDEVHEEACRLEHVISGDFEARIAAALGHPRRDPHGDPIPDAGLVMPGETTYPLSSLRADQKAVVMRVNDDDPYLLRHLSEIGLTPQTHLTVLAHSPFDHNLTVQVEDRSPVVLGMAITYKVFVKLSTD